MWFIVPLSIPLRHQIDEIDYWISIIFLDIAIIPITMLFGIWIPLQKKDKETKRPTANRTSSNKKEELTNYGQITENDLETKSKGEDLADKVNEELKYYEQAGEEWDSGNTVKGLVAKAKVESLGDKLKTEAIYIKLRSEMLVAIAEEAAIAENSKKENAKKVLKVMVTRIHKNKNLNEEPFYKKGEDAFIRFNESKISGNGEIATFEYKNVIYVGQIISDFQAEGK
jgi:hypothetical protein